MQRSTLCMAVMSLLFFGASKKGGGTTTWVQTIVMSSTSMCNVRDMCFVHLLVRTWCLIPRFFISLFTAWRIRYSFRGWRHKSEVHLVRFISSAKSVRTQRVRSNVTEPEPSACKENAALIRLRPRVECRRKKNRGRTAIVLCKMATISMTHRPIEYTWTTYLLTLSFFLWDVVLGQKYIYEHQTWWACSLSSLGKQRQASLFSAKSADYRSTGIFWYPHENTSNYNLANAISILFVIVWYQMW